LASDSAVKQDNDWGLDGSKFSEGNCASLFILGAKINLDGDGFITKREPFNRGSAAFRWNNAQFGLKTELVAGLPSA
jgi:hypothetical protein